MTKISDPITLNQPEDTEVGRPRIDLDDAFTKIQPYLLLGYSLYKACILAEIPYTTLKGHYDTNDNFRSKCEHEKSLVSARARQNLVNAINSNDIKTSLDWLERQEKDDFSTKTEVDVTNRDEAVLLLRAIIIERRQKAKGIDAGHIQSLPDKRENT